MIKLMLGVLKNYFSFLLYDHYNDYYSVREKNLLKSNLI